MDLSRMPRGSTNSKNCTLKVTDPKSPSVSLFKVKRIKAWWPFSFVTNEGESIQAVRKLRKKIHVYYIFPTYPNKRKISQ